MIRSHEALQYHEGGRPGKITLAWTKPCLTPRDMRLAYLPGAAFPSGAIAADPLAAWRYTSRANLVGVVTNGTAVPGLGNVGPLAAKPMQEGIAILFKRLADIDVFDIELDAPDPETVIEAVRAIAPTFGGINLKDIQAPDGLVIFDRLRAGLDIPVFHENLYSTAVVALAALHNALELVEKQAGSIRVVVSGAGTVGIGCARLLLQFGVQPENLLLYDVKGLIHPDREDLTDYQRAFAREGEGRTLAEGIRGADAFIGASAAGVLTQGMIRDMARFPIVLALATPEPEIGYEAARASRRDVVVATSDPACPNAITDLLSFPYIFRGALDARASTITEGMLLAASRALADLAREDVIDEVARAYDNLSFCFGPEYLIPRAIDPRILVWESAAVLEAAVAEGIAQRPLKLPEYRESLAVRIGTGRETLRRLILKARRSPLRVVFPEGAHETILRACHLLEDEGIASPILLGREEEIRDAIQRLGIELRSAQLIDPAKDPRREAHTDAFFELRRRRGVTRSSAAKRMALPDYFGAMMLRAGEADLMITGVTAHYAESMRTVLESIGPAAGRQRVSSLYMVLLQRRAIFLADCAINIDPSAETLCETALSAASLVRSLDMEPRVAMLSFANFGSVDHPFTRKVRAAVQLLRERAPDLMADGEMQLGAAVDATLRAETFPFSNLTQDANVLVFPDLQSGNLALQALAYLSDAVLVGPVLMNADRPVHILQYGSTVNDVVNLTAMGVVQAAAERRMA